MNWKGFGRKQSWPRSRLTYCPDICEERVRKTMKTSVTIASATAKSLIERFANARAFAALTDLFGFQEKTRRGQSQNS
jgi:hypothetical protein